MHRDEGGASFRLIDPTNSVTSIVKTFQELGKNLGSIVILPIVRYRPAPTSPRVHEDSKDRCSLLNDRGSIDRPRHCERETHLPEARVKRETDSKEDRFGTADLTRYPR